MAEDLGEKTEEATPKRRQEAREEGNIAKSQDLASALLLLVGVLLVWAVLSRAAGGLRIMVENALAADVIGNPTDPDDVLMAVTHVAASVLRWLIPMVLVTWVFAYLVHFWQVGWLVSSKVLQPKWSKLNPISGFKRVFGVRGMVKAAMDVGKVAIVLTVAAITILSHEAQVLVLPQLSALAAASLVSGLVLEVALKVVAVLIILGIIDFAFQRMRHSRDLRMTKQQVKDEMKQSEGDPEVKRRRLRMQQQITMQRISTSVPKADVIVTNPEHIAIAIQYDASKMHAPKVVAKGADFLALRIRQIAMKHGIPIIERKPLARALYKQVGVGQEVPPEFYKAVAEILAYVYRLSGRKAG